MDRLCLNYTQVLVERFGLAARFGFIHLAATNIAVWVRLVIWDSAQEWTYFVHLAQRGLHNSVSPLNLRGFPESLIRHTRDLIGSFRFELSNEKYLFNKILSMRLYFRSFFKRKGCLPTLSTNFERTDQSSDCFTRMLEHEYPGSIMDI